MGVKCSDIPWWRRLITTCDPDEEPKKKGNSERQSLSDVMAMNDADAWQAAQDLKRKNSGK